MLHNIPEPSNDATETLNLLPLVLYHSGQAIEEAENLQSAELSCSVCHYDQHCKGSKKTNDLRPLSIAVSHAEKRKRYAQLTRGATPQSRTIEETEKTKMSLNVL